MQLLAEIAVEPFSGLHLTDVLFNADRISDCVVIRDQAARDQSAQIQCPDQVVARLNQLAAHAVAPVVANDYRIHPVQPFAFRVMRGQSAITGDFRPGAHIVLEQVYVQAQVGAGADHRFGVGIQRHKLAFGEDFEMLTEFSCRQAFWLFVIFRSIAIRNLMASLHLISVVDMPWDNENIRVPALSGVGIQVGVHFLVAFYSFYDKFRFGTFPGKYQDWSVYRPVFDLLSRSSCGYKK